MKVIHLKQNKEVNFSSVKQYVKEIHKLSEQYLTISNSFTIDMDGVQVYDDALAIATEFIKGKKGIEYFGKVAKMNIEAVSQRETSYCWYGILMFGILLENNPVEMMRKLGRDVRYIPTAKQFFDEVGTLGPKGISVTAAPQDSAEEVSDLLGIERTFGTIFNHNGITYDGTIQRYIGGEYKAKLIEELFGNILHIGDSWSDVESFKNENSAALNPGCEPAFRNAVISILSPNLISLLPFFDTSGKLDELYNESNLPRKIIISEGEFNQELLEESLRIKRIEIPSMLEEKVFTPSPDLVRNELPPIEKFDSLAKAAFEIFKTKNEIKIPWTQFIQTNYE